MLASVSAVRVLALVLALTAALAVAAPAAAAANPWLKLRVNPRPGAVRDGSLPAG